MRMLFYLVYYLHVFLVCCLHMRTDDRVPTELKKAIMQARMDKKLTQAQLAQVSLLYSYTCDFSTCARLMIFLVALSGVTSFFSLEQLINEKPQIIQEYESGKAIPNQQIISKLERALGAKLRGKK